MSANTLPSLVADGRKLLDGPSRPTPAHLNFRSWVNNVARWLDAKAPDSGLSAEWSSLPTSPLVIAGSYYDDPASWSGYKRAVQQRLGWLASAPTRMLDHAESAITASSATASKEADLPRSTNRVFLVHGQENEARETTARFLEKIGLECVILHEQPNAGRTLIEKFEHYTDVAFAVILLTPDDVGGLLKESAANQKPRARQNVILELGFFLGKLGRSRVCPLYSEGVEIPSDYSGVAFVKFDPDGAWKLTLLRELKEGGIAVDANKAF